MQSTTLTDLAEEYIQSAGNLTCMIASCNEKLRRARQNGDAEQAFRLHMNLTDLYAQRTELRQIAVFLKNYYNKDRERIQ
ncbi:MAG: hypothetical protein IKW76_01665 [Clostridia bacterium]|nr:hypothetical protein [Clostridia bacterium]